MKEKKRQSLQKISEGNLLYKTVFNQSPDGILIIDTDGSFIDFNEAAHRQLGYTREEFEKLNITDIDPVQRPEEVQASIQALMENGSAEFDVKHRTKDGTIRDVHVITQLITVSGQTLFHTIWCDITERKRAEEALKKTARDLSEAQSIARIGRWEHDVPGNRVTWSGETYRIFEADPREFGSTYEAFLNTVHPDDRAGVTAAYADSLKNRTPYSIDFRLLLPSGRIKYIHAQSETLFENDKPVHSTGIVQDITERKLIEEALKRSEQFTRNMLDTVDEGFIVIDPDFRIVTANKAYCSQVGGGQNIIGRHCYEVSHRSSRPCYDEGEECVARHVFETRKPSAALHKHIDAKGMIMYVETKGFPVLDGSGAVTSVIETINNITEKQLLEEERLKTQKLESIGTLAGGIAHDFNNLLQGVFGYISMAKLTLDQKDRAQSMLEEAEKALHQSVNLTSQLLTFSKGGKPVKATISLAPAIKNAVKFALSGSSSTYELRLAPDLWQVEADEGQLGQVIQNIVLNADQAMPVGGKVVIRAQNVPASDDHLPRELNHRDAVLISIEDSGVGIPEPHISRIFDPYFTTKEKGSGLGLATSYSIIRNHGGAIHVQSRVDLGSTFFLYLPASDKVARQTQNPTITPGRRTGRVLLMDDEKVVRMVAKEMLNELGHEVAIAETGETAIEAYRAFRDSGRPFDVVILDLTVRGGMGGAETLQALLKIDPGVKAVVSSGYSDKAIISHYQEKGFKTFLKKPYTVDDLRDVLNKVLKP